MYVYISANSKCKNIPKINVITTPLWGYVFFLKLPPNKGFIAVTIQDRTSNIIQQTYYKTKYYDVPPGRLLWGYI